MDAARGSMTDSVGTRPANLPVVLPTKYEFVINLKTAKAFASKFPTSCWH